MKAARPRTKSHLILGTTN